eukprot:TRINITY_DN145_c0_g1_i1.p1 TRINITY_DN145_c0_g1~~TRINITY_DN145_c0_g1_i1.p1  ORF type:complete len:225 (-),score=48.12 TRINITY_DN145_c0_g1_i1:75-749(-)
MLWAWTGKQWYQRRVRGAHIKDSPVTLGVLPGIDPSKCTCSGPGLGPDVFDTKPTQFTITSKDVTGAPLSKGGFPFESKIIGPTGEEVPCKVEDLGDGTYTVDYAPTEKGPHTVAVTLQGKPVQDSPFTVKVKPGADYHHTCIEMFSFTIQARTKTGEPHTKGGDPFAASVTGPAGPIKVPPKVADVGNGTYAVSYSLPDRGTYTVAATLHGEHIVRSPMTQTF